MSNFHRHKISSDARKARNKGITMFAVGNSGTVDHDELNKISSPQNGTNEHLRIRPDFLIEAHSLATTKLTLSVAKGNLF